MRRHIWAAVRFGLLTMIVVGAFWGIWWALGGTVPVTEYLGHGEEAFRLPVAYSRWLDPVAAFLTVVILWTACAAAIKLDSSQDEAEGGLFAGLVTGVMVTFYLMICLPILPIMLAAIAAILGLIVWLVGWMLDPRGIAVMILGIFITPGLFIGLTLGIGIGLAITLAGTAIAHAVFVIPYVLRLLFLNLFIKRGCLRRCWNWLTACDKQ